MQSGIVPLDHHLGGIQRGRLHLLTGGSGAGKTTACLQFLQAGLRSGDAGLLITMDRVADLASHARSVGLQLEASVRADRLLVARCRGQFAGQLAATSPTAPAAELARLIADSRPARVVIDSLAALLLERTAGVATLAAVVEVLESCGATTFLTYPADVSRGCDVRLAPVVQHVAAIVHLLRGDAGVHDLRVIQARWRPAPPHDIQFAFTPGVGLVVMPDARHPIEVELMPAPPAKRARARKVSP